MVTRAMVNQSWTPVQNYVQLNQGDALPTLSTLGEEAVLVDLLTTIIDRSENDLSSIDVAGPLAV
jgi:hypothetical protein